MMANKQSCMNTKVFFYFFLATCVILMFYLNLSIRKESLPIMANGTFEDAYNNLKKEGISYQACIFRNLGEATNATDKLWNKIQSAVETCVEETKFKDLELSYYKNNDETKFYIHDDNMETQKSIVLTLGVGKDVAVEQKLKELLSKDSEFFAADPMPENAPIFAPVGFFVPLAVGKTTGVSNASVLTEAGDYQTRPMMHIDIMTFMTQIVRQKKIDMFLMDNEGPEYDIQPMMAKGRNFDKAGITVCQVNVEFHWGNMERFNKVIMDMLYDNRFIPLHTVVPGHVRMFMVNIETPYCVKRYLAKYFVLK